MNKEIELSVVLAAFNVEHSLPECLDSLTGQTGSSVEFVCVDDGSTDSCGKILDEYARKDPRFRIIHLQENRGTLLARKAGVEQASGKYLMFVDGDDELRPGAAARALEMMAAGADVAVFGCELNFQDPSVDQTPYRDYFEVTAGDIAGSDGTAVLAACVSERRFSWHLWNKVYRADLVRRAADELPDVKIVQAEDLSLSFRVLARCRSCSVFEDRLYAYRIGCGVSTRGKMDERAFVRYCDYVEICRQLRDWVKRQQPTQGLESCQEAVFRNTERMFAGIFKGRLEKSCRNACLAYFYRRCREADLLRLFQNCEGLSVADLEATFAPEPASDLPKPVFDRTDAAVCIVSSDEYAPFAGTVVTSIVANAKPERNYDIVLLTESMTPRNQARICALARPNVSIRVVDISKYISGLEFYTWAHFTPHTYYRLLAPDIFSAYDRLVYLDSDLVVNRDIADLYAEDLEGWLLAAALDTQVLAMCERPQDNAETIAYLRDTLRLKDCRRYFQGGVALYNLAEFRKAFEPGHLIREALSHEYRWFDQDVLNVQCEGRIRELANNWNTTPASPANRFFEVQLPPGRLEAYVAARRDPWIVHYIDRRLPCLFAGADLEEYFWKYARQSPFYETLLSKLTEVALDKRDAPVQGRLRAHDYRLSVLEDCTPMRLWRRFAGVARKCMGLVRRSGEDEH